MTFHDHSFEFSSSIPIELCFFKASSAQRDYVYVPFFYFTAPLCVGWHVDLDEHVGCKVQANYVYTNCLLLDTVGFVLQKRASH